MNSIVNFDSYNKIRSRYILMIKRRKQQYVSMFESVIADDHMFDPISPTLLLHDITHCLRDQSSIVRSYQVFELEN